MVADDPSCTAFAADLASIDGIDVEPALTNEVPRQPRLWDALIVPAKLPWIEAYREHFGLAGPVLVVVDHVAALHAATGQLTSADDFLIATAHPIEIAFRIRAAVQRHQLGCVLRAGRMRLDLAAHRLRIGELDSEVVIELTKAEVQLLWLLMRKAGLWWTTPELLARRHRLVHDATASRRHVVPLEPPP